MVETCISNGGIYVKLGQGLSTMNQVLPEEFYLTLRRLQNEALRAEGTDVIIFFLIKINSSIFFFGIFN
jgi:aarF domain-containing kinase